MGDSETSVVARGTTSSTHFAHATTCVFHPAPQDAKSGSQEEKDAQEKIQWKQNHADYFGVGYAGADGFIKATGDYNVIMVMLDDDAENILKTKILKKASQGKVFFLSAPNWATLLSSNEEKIDAMIAMPHIQQQGWTDATWLSSWRKHKKARHQMATHQDQANALSALLQNYRRQIALAVLFWRKLLIRIWVPTERNMKSKIWGYRLTSAWLRGSVQEFSSRYSRIHRADGVGLGVSGNLRKMTQFTKKEDDAEHFITFPKADYSEQTEPFYLGLCLGDQQDIFSILLEKMGFDFFLQNIDADILMRLVFQSSPNDQIPLLLLKHGGPTNVEANVGAYGESDDRGFIALHAAAWYGCVDTVKALLFVGHQQDGEADPTTMDDDGSLPLHCAASAGHDDIVRLILEDPKSRGNFGVNAIRRGMETFTALHLAAHAGHTDVVRALVQTHGADVSSADNLFCETALHEAAKLGRTDTVIVLVRDLGADVSATSKFGYTALHEAAKLGHTDTVIVLVRDLGADVSATDDYGNTALHKAADYGPGLGTVTALVRDLGANVSATNTDGETALHVAAARSYRQTVTALVRDLGADSSARNNRGETARDRVSQWDKTTESILLASEEEHDRKKTEHDRFLRKKEKQSKSKKPDPENQQRWERGNWGSQTPADQGAQGPV